MHVLVLNIDYSPLEVVEWTDAVRKLLAGKVEMVEHYAGQFIRSPSLQLPFPAVVRLVTGYVRRKVRLSRKHVIERDAYTCQYCGAKPRRSSGVPDFQALTIDHVVPKAQASGGRVVLPWSQATVRVNSWENVLTACSPCNSRKADRTPKQASMSMRRAPRVPSPVDLARMSILRYEAPPEWASYLNELVD